MSESKLNDYLKQTDRTGEEWLWKRQAAAALEVTEKTLERRASAGKIAQMERDRKIFYKVSDLLEFEKEKDSETLRAVPMERQETMQTNLVRQEQTDNSFNNSLMSDSKMRMEKALIEKAEAEAERAVYEKFLTRLTFSLDEAAEVFNLSIVDLKAKATTFKGKNQKLMITRKNLDLYLNNL